jgi:(1->4)-alpha-D-glucan 1-alpha-D-glucosylmutase
MSDPMTERPLRATYRLQLTSDFGFAEAQARIPYLRDLGISHLYLSPSLQARHGSTHGYDVVDPTRISEDLGGEAALRALADAAHGAGLGLVLDIVPNHMATDDANPFWADPALRERFFDIDHSTHPPRHRRFFDIDDLAGVRQEDPAVFEQTHRLVLALLAEGVIDGLRIDHPDGLTDPLQYFERLRAGGATTVWIEKILEDSEPLRDWPVTGTVGYEFLNQSCAVFVDPAGEAGLTALWQELSGDARPFAEVALEAKREQATTTFTPEFDRLASIIDVPGGRAALCEVAARFPVYRTYVRFDADGNAGSEPADADAVTVTGARRELADLLLARAPVTPEFPLRFQQTTSPVVAKGIEDTAFYRYGRLLALNDVGGDPGRFGLHVDAFHEANLDRARRFPEAMLTTMTHDTKRSTDVRSRIAAVSWIPGEWAEHVRTWVAVTEPLRHNGAPDGNELSFIFQTLAGAWPIEAERVTEYMIKAMREAKRNTNWIERNAEWEDSVTGFVQALYSHRPFLIDFEPFVARLTKLGDWVTLGMTTLKLTCPGVPDIYQGDELPLRALVDPDNRRPVDWEWHDATMARLQGGAPYDASNIKLFLCMQLLGLRIRRPRTFGREGGYRPVPAGDGVVAFTRGDGADEVLVIVATRMTPPPGYVPAIGGHWRPILGGEEYSLQQSIPVDRLLGPNGIAVLERA